MSVAVSCNLSDGVILGVDSAVTVATKGGIAKVYEHAQKLLPIQDKPIGVAVFGLANIRERTIGSYLREFEVKNPHNVLNTAQKMADIVEEIRVFFWNLYQTEIIPAVVKAKGIEFDKVPDGEKPVLGLVIGGFLPGAYLSEVWQILLPLASTPNSAKEERKQGNFGSNWFSLFEPIRRYSKGIDLGLFNELMQYFEKLLGRKFTPQEIAAVTKIRQKYEYQIPYGAMPIDEGIAWVKFLVELVINHFRYAVGAPVVGGKARIGLVTYKEKIFQIVKS